MERFQTCQSKKIGENDALICSKHVQFNSFANYLYGTNFRVDYLNFSFQIMFDDASRFY